MAFDAAPITRVKTDCALCPVDHCIGGDCGSGGSASWSAVLGHPVAMMPGRAPLCEAGQSLGALYLVRAGCLKTYTVDGQGNEHIRGFYLAGDLVGLDALGGSRTLAAVAAVVPSQVCVAPVAEVRRRLGRDPALAQRLTELTSRELALALAISGDFNSEQRLAAFLLHMEERLDARAGALHLPMTRRDIGNYLRLATETVCRTLKAFERRGWLRCEERCIRLLARQKLFEVGAPVGICARPGTALPLAA